MHLKYVSGVFFIALAFAGCTIEQKGAQTNAEFHEPFTTQHWNLERQATANGQNACTISSGYGGLTFVVRPKADGHAISVQSNRYMRAGTVLIVTVNGHRYETSNASFSARDAVALADDFSAGGKAYAEWSELKFENGRSRYTAIYDLTGFKDKLNDCMK